MNVSVRGPAATRAALRREERGGVYAEQLSSLSVSWPPPCCCPGPFIGLLRPKRAPQRGGQLVELVKKLKGLPLASKALVDRAAGNSGTSTVI